jgi:hypothetical protein
LVPIILIVPWRQGLIWDTGDGIVVPIKVVRYGFCWNRPLEASLDVRRIVTEILLLAVAIVVASQFERLRLSEGSAPDFR